VTILYETEKEGMSKVTLTEKLLIRLIDWAIKRATKGPSETWSPGKKLRIFLCGYNGKRNTGSDVRVKAMIDQFYQILGKENTEIGVLTFNKELTEIYAEPPTHFLEFSSTNLGAIAEGISKYHMTVISEGSTLMPEWSNLMVVWYASVMGANKKLKKPCLAYGAGLSKLEGIIREFVQRNCDEAYFIVRDQRSFDFAKDLGLKAELGVDTAWIFPSLRTKWAIQDLKEKGWDGKKPLLGIAVINPFAWPVYPDFFKWLTGYGKRHPELWYENYLFRRWSREKEMLYERYIDAFAYAINEFTKHHDVQVVIFGMEALDWWPINKLNEKLKTPGILYSSRYYDGYQITSLLRMLSMLVSSRYHACVLAMAAGVPSIGVSKDVRIENLLTELGNTEYLLRVDEEGLSEKLLDRMEKMWERKEKMKSKIVRAVPKYVKAIAKMGESFRNFVEQNFPGIKLPPEPADWRGYLPPLDAETTKLLERFD
jgi:polysaccharide pyruvyl transferase WcaK-like protein